MPLDLVTTAYGRPALRALGAAVAAAKGADVLAPVTVVVPSNHVGVAARRLLAGGHVLAEDTRRGIVGVTFLTPYRLAELLGANRLAAEGRRPVSTPVVAAALRQALAVDPGAFAPVAQHPATEAALVAAYGQLSDLSDGALAALGRASARAGDVVRLCRSARARLAGSWYDEADLADAAVEATVAGDPVVAGVGNVVVHLVQELTRHQAQLLRAVADRWPTSVVAAVTGSGPADAGVQRSLDRLGCKPTGDTAVVGPSILGGPPAAGEPGPGATAAPSSATLEPASGVAWPVDAERTRVLTASDADDEVRAAVRAVIAAARAGTPLERIAVLFGTVEPYGRLLHEHLVAAGVPRNGTAVRPLAASAVGRLVSDLLALPDHGFRRGEVMGLLSRSAVRTPAGAPAPTNEWERMTREAGVVSGRADWDVRLAALVAAIDQRADDLAPPEPPAGVEAVEGAGLEPDEEELAARRMQAQSDHMRRRAGRARDLREVALHLVDELTAAAGPEPETWRARARWLRRVAESLLGDADHRTAWPADEHRAADRVDAALERLAALDAVDGPPSLDTFRRTLLLELEADLGRVGRFGEGVLVAPLSFAPGLDLDLVVVVGLAEGTLPGVVRDDSLLPDGERRRTNGELPLRRERVERDHRHLRAALAGADRHLLCAPRGDLRASNERVPSRWMLGVASTLAGRPLAGDAFLALDEPWVDHVPSYAHAVTHAAFPATAQDYRLRAGAARTDDAVARAGAEVLQARRGHDFTRFDGNLAGVVVPTPIDATTSSTRLESWATCPHAYFVRYLLGVEPIDDPERQLSITPIDKGSLVHEVLETFIRAVLARPPGERPAPDEPWTTDDHRLMAAIAARACDAYEARGMTGRPVFWRRDRAQVLALADRFLREDERFRRAARARPFAAELTFGRFGVEVPPVEVLLDDGRLLHFSGAIDRLDVTDDGTIVVTDYKTGSSSRFRRLSPDDPDNGGTHLQLAVYALAARATCDAPEAPVRSDYWFVSDREGFERKGYLVDEAVLTRIRSVLTTITRGIEQGIFPSRPEDTGGGYVSCRYCDPDGMGVTELRRDWERLREHPDVALYADLAEPRNEPDDPPPAPDDTTASGSATALGTVIVLDPTDGGPR